MGRTAGQRRGKAKQEGSILNEKDRRFSFCAAMTLFLAACGGKASSSSSQPLPVPPEVFSSSEAMMRETVQLQPYSFDLPGPEEDPEADPLVGAVMAGLLICGVVLLLIRLLWRLRALRVGGSQRRRSPRHAVIRSRPRLLTLLRRAFSALRQRLRLAFVQFCRRNTPRRRLYRYRAPWASARRGARPGRNPLRLPAADRPSDLCAGPRFACRAGTPGGAAGTRLLRRRADARPFGENGARPAPPHLSCAAAPAAARCAHPFPNQTAPPRRMELPLTPSAPGAKRRRPSGFLKLEAGYSAAPFRARCPASGAVLCFPAKSAGVDRLFIFTPCLLHKKQLILEKNGIKSVN